MRGPLTATNPIDSHERWSAQTRATPKASTLPSPSQAGNYLGDAIAQGG